MPFQCDAATLERLEWPRLAERLAEQASTQRGAEACREGRFEAAPEGVAARLAETTEVRGLLDAGEDLAFGGIHDLRALLVELGKGVRPSAEALARVLTSLQASRRLASFLRGRAERAPRLAARARVLPDLRRLESALVAKIDPAGELRPDASRELSRARRRVRDLEAEIGRRMDTHLKAPGILTHLQDRYSTFRQGRAVLPVRADARGGVRGIVHDVSSSGTTVFIEPQDVVELGNRLRLAQVEVEREMDRLLRALGDEVAAEASALEGLGAALEELDAAAARGRLSRRLDAVAPEVAVGGRLELHGLRHPLLLLESGLDPAEVVPNGVTLPETVRGLVISGPNAGGKTVVAKALGLAALAVRAGLHVPCDPQSRLPIFDAVCADIGDEQDLRSGLSTFSARMANLARILEVAGESTLVILDEVGEGTEPGEGAALAQTVLEALVERGAHVVATTHFNRLKELAGSDARFLNASAEFDTETLLPTYRLQLGAPGSSGAAWVAERMGLEPALVERARALLDREDRRLEALTRSLSELRQELEAERHLAARMREQSEAVRSDYEERLRVLRSAREKVLAGMKADLEGAFREARAEVARIVRSLQRGDRPDGRAANRARRALDEVRTRTRRVEDRHTPPPPAAPAVEWSGLEPGTRLQIEGVPGEAILVEPPDRKGRLIARVGGARMTVAAGRVRRIEAPRRPLAAPGRGVSVERTTTEEPLVAECDLRGLRVDEALDRADAHLYRVLGSGLREVTFIHGHGSGALRSAIRAWLTETPQVVEFAPGPASRGGNGVTIAILAG